ncbi:MAG: DNA polymerase III subunit gamma/tau [Opitutaceae bacterium]|nr:DNA polymerase III subunit gamma/tau [Opitutaceae bacterium]
MTALPWPAALVGTPSIAVIEQAIARQRLSHSLLLHGDDLGTLVGVAHSIADRLLNPPDARAHFAVKDHPDYLALRPKGKTRIIPIGKSDSPEAGTMREFLPKLYVTPAVAPQKVAIIYEADRMNTESSNAFLKTLEEPPGHTTLLLLTTRPYALLPTIRSRTLHFRFPSAAAPITTDGWQPWLEDYRAWLGRLSEGVGSDKHAIADHVFTLYGLVARFSAVLDFATAEVWKEQKAKLPEELSDDEAEAIETGIANGLRARLFAEIEHATCAFALPRLNAGDESARRAVTAAIDKLEHDIGLLRLNLNEAAALEDFLLGSLRLWATRRS